MISILLVTLEKCHDMFKLNKNLNNSLNSLKLLHLFQLRLVIDIVRGKNGALFKNTRGYTIRL